jgi:DNA-binding response OmpR family regulator
MEPAIGCGGYDKAYMRILVISNNLSDRNELVEYMHRRSFQAACMSEPANLGRHLVSDEPNLVVLELAHDSRDCLRLLNEIKSQRNIPVIAITGHESCEFDRATALELGADDCLTRPFNPRELVARIGAILRRVRRAIESPSLNVKQIIQSPPQKTIYWFVGWNLNLRIRRLTNSKGARVPLTAAEYALLLTFIEAPQRPLTREFLVQATHLREDVAPRSIDVQVMRLRRKLAPDPNIPDLIKTAPGIGYVFNAPVKVIDPPQKTWATFA